MKKLYRVLRENHALHRYENNMLKEHGMASVQKTIEKLITRGVPNAIMGGFNWAKTNEGNDFWSELFMELCKCNTIPL